MNDDKAKIIVITPIKNEDWILDQFLSVCSFFADHIIIADQQSDDKSVEICKKYSKVLLFENTNLEYNEASRQELLINKARELFDNQKIVLLALDADEIISFSSINNLKTWDLIRYSEPGTTFLFEKPDILHGLSKCIRWEDNYFPLAYVDDGAKHNPQKIHSRRIPISPIGKTIKITDIKIVHFAISRINVQSAKMRYYSILENVNNTSPFYIRRKIYHSFFNSDKFYSSKLPSEVPGNWIDDWANKNIHFANLEDPIFSWYDLKSLEMIKIYGSKKFFLDDIWEFDWNNCYEHWRKIKTFDNDFKIVYPTVLFKYFTKATDFIFSILSNTKKHFKG